MLSPPLLTALLLLGRASAHQQPQPHQQPLGAADDDDHAASSTLPTTGPALTANPPPRPPVMTSGRECRALHQVFRGVDAAVEGAAYAGASGLSALYVCRRRDGPDCELAGGVFASVAASLFLVLRRFGESLLDGYGGVFGWFSVDDVTFFSSAGSLAYQIYLSVWSGPASQRTVVWSSINFFQALILLYRGLRDGLAPGEGTRLLLLGSGQTMICLVTLFTSAIIMPHL